MKWIFFVFLILNGLSHAANQSSTTQDLINSSVLCSREDYTEDDYVKFSGCVNNSNLSAECKVYMNLYEGIQCIKNINANTCSVHFMKMSAHSAAFGHLNRNSPEAAFIEPLWNQMVAICAADYEGDELIDLRSYSQCIQPMVEQLGNQNNCKL